MLTFEDVTRLADSLPGVEVSTSYGTPALKVRGKLLARMWPDGKVIVVMVSLEDQEMLLRSNPNVYFLTDHYVGYPCVLVNLAVVAEADLKEDLEQAWRRVAPARMVAALDTERANSA